MNVKTFKNCSKVWALEWAWQKVLCLIDKN